MLEVEYPGVEGDGDAVVTGLEELLVLAVSEAQFHQCHVVVVDGEGGILGGIFAPVRQVEPIGYAIPVITPPNSFSRISRFLIISCAIISE